MATKNNPTARQTDILVQEHKDEVLIYDLQIHKAYCLNKTSALVYQLCDGNNSISNIKELISKKLKQPVTEDLVWLALDQLKEDNLLSKSNELEIKFNGLSRREVIKKVGLASMVAVPFISSLVAPPAISAQSAGVCPSLSPCPTSIPSGCPCTLNCSNCVGGACNTITGRCT